MKKLGLVLVLVAIAAGGAFAQFDMSVGGGGIFDLSMGNGMTASGGGQKLEYELNNTSFGGFVFFDITYAEIEVDYLYGTTETVVDGKTAKGNEGVFNQVGIGVLGKYPISLGAATLFPMIGINYNMVMSYELDGKEYKKVLGNDGKSYEISEYFSQLGILAGLGLDFGLTDQMFLRAEALFHIRLPNKDQETAVDYYNKFPGVSAESTLGMGARVKIGIGYKL